MLQDRVLLRKIVNETIPTGGVDSATLFTDIELDNILAAFYPLSMAAAVAWAIKAGKLAELIDIEESGSRRRLQQKHINALKTAEFWQKAAGTDQAAIARAIRVAGIGASPWLRFLRPEPVENIIAQRAGGTWIDIEPWGAGLQPIGWCEPIISNGTTANDIPVDNYPLDIEKGRTVRLSVVYSPDGATVDLTGWLFAAAIKGDVTDVDFEWEGTTTDGALTVDALSGTINLTILAVDTETFTISQGEWELVGTSPTGDSVPILSGPVYVSTGVL